MKVNHSGLKNKHLKMCPIAVNCFNLFMHAAKTIQAASYKIMTVSCLIKRIQNSIVHLHEIGLFAKMFN